MKELLTEFLRDLFEAQPVSSAAQQAKQKNLVHLGYGKYGPAKGRPATHQTDDRGNLVPIRQKQLKQPKAQRKSPATATPKTTASAPTTTQSVTPELNKLKKFTSGLTKLARVFQDKVYSGAGQSIGTKSSTQGEHSSCVSTQDFCQGTTVDVDGHTVPVPFGVTRAQIKTEIQRIAAGRGGKNLSSYELTNRAIESAWINNERDRYINSGNEPPEDDWLKYAYRSGLSSVAALRENPEYQADITATSTAMKNKQLPPPMVMNAENRAATIDYINSTLKNSTTPQETEHYKSLLIAMDVAEDTDTVVHFIRNDGLPDMLLVSNKKTSNDPHGNTTPVARIKTLRSLLSSDPVVAKEISNALEEAQSIISRGGDVVSVAREHFGQMSPKNKQLASDLFRKRFKQLPADRGTTKDYTATIINSRPVKIALENMYCEQYSDRCKKGKPIKEIPVNYKVNNVGSAFIRSIETLPEEALAPSILTKILGKVGDVSTADDAKILGPILDAGKQTRQAAKDAHDLIVTRLTDADERICTTIPDKCQDGNGNPINGPATKAYINAFMQDTHWDQYICNSDDCSRQDAISAKKMVDMNGTKVTPSKFRDCLASISNFNGDPHSHGGQRSLWDHLQNSLIVRAGEDSISIRDGDGVKKIGKETYRTKGSNASLLTFLGKDMTDCVTNKATTYGS